jgi:hypothetical protein
MDAAVSSGSDGSMIGSHSPSVDGRPHQLFPPSSPLEQRHFGASPAVVIDLGERPAWGLRGTKPTGLDAKEDTEVLVEPDVGVQHDLRIARRSRFERQNTFGKILGKHCHCRCRQCRAPPAFEQCTNALEDFGLIDVRRVEPRTGLRRHPSQHCWMRFPAHQPPR